jgi:hypothetical protein
VYRALNWGTGETVAVKKVKLADLPKSELRVIMVSAVWTSVAPHQMLTIGYLARDRPPEELESELVFSCRCSRCPPLTCQDIYALC